MSLLSADKQLQVKHQLTTAYILYQSIKHTYVQGESKNIKNHKRMLQFIICILRNRKKISHFLSTKAVCLTCKSAKHAEFPTQRFF